MLDVLETCPGGHGLPETPTKDELRTTESKPVGNLLFLLLNPKP